MHPKVAASKTAKLMEELKIQLDRIEAKLDAVLGAQNAKPGKAEKPKPEAKPEE